MQTATMGITESTATKPADTAKVNQCARSQTAVVPAGVNCGTSQTFVRHT